MKMRLQLKKNEIKVGIFVLIPILSIFIITLLKLGYSLSSSTYDLYLKVDNINSIKVGTAVKVKGYNIGKIVSIRPVYQPSLHFLALMRVNNEITLYDTCSVVIQNQNVIGDPMIEIKNPESARGILRNGDVLEGVEYVNVEALLQDVHNLLASATGTINVVKGIGEESKGNIRRMTTDLSSSLATVNSMLASSQRDIVDIMASFRKTAITMEEISNELKKHPVKFLMK